jgi:hypothetical protein
MTPLARAGLSEDSARAARLLLGRPRKRVDAVWAWGLLTGPPVDVEGEGEAKGLSVPPLESRCNAAGDLQPDGTVPSSWMRIAVMAGLMLFCRPCIPSFGLTINPDGAQRAKTSTALAQYTKALP